VPDKVEQAADRSETIDFVSLLLRRQLEGLRGHHRFGSVSLVGSVFGFDAG